MVNSKRLLSIQVSQDKLGKLLGYGSLILKNRANELYEYRFLDNPYEVQDIIMVSYENMMKRLDPNFVSSYKLTKQKASTEVLDTIED